MSEDKDYDVKDEQGNEWTVSGDVKVHCDRCGEETETTVEQCWAMPSPRPRIYCEACKRRIN